MRTLLVTAALALLALASTPVRADEPGAPATPPAPGAAAPAAPAPAAPATVADDAIANDRVGPFALGASSKDVIDAALKAFKKKDVKLGEKDLQLPGLKLKFTVAGAKGVLESIEVAKGGLKYRTAEGVGPGSSEKDIRLAYRDAVKRTKVGKLDSLTPDSLPNVHFVCSKGGIFSSESCKTVTLTLAKRPKKAAK